MRILIAGAANPLAKEFIKQNKKKHELIALDEKKADFTDYAPVREIFQTYRFDAVLYFTAVGCLGKPAVCTGSAVLLKNLAYAAALSNTRFLVTADADKDVFFNDLAAGLAARDKTVTLLRVFGLIGKGLSVKTNFMMKLLSDANKTGRVELACDRAISLVHTEDALAVLTELLQNESIDGCVDLAPPKSITLASVARAAKRILGDTLEIKVLKKGAGADYAGDPSRLKDAHPKFKFMSQNQAIERVLGNV